MACYPVASSDLIGVPSSQPSLLVSVPGEDSTSTVALPSLLIQERRLFSTLQELFALHGRSIQIVDAFTNRIFESDEITENVLNEFKTGLRPVPKELREISDKLHHQMDVLRIDDFVKHALSRKIPLTCGHEFVFSKDCDESQVRNSFLCSAILTSSGDINKFYSSFFREDSFCVSDSRTIKKGKKEVTVYMGGQIQLVKKMTYKFDSYIQVGRAVILIANNIMPIHKSPETTTFLNTTVLLFKERLDSDPDKTDLNTHYVLGEIEIIPTMTGSIRILEAVVKDAAEGGSAWKDVASGIKSMFKNNFCITPNEPEDVSIKSNKTQHSESGAALSSPESTSTAAAVIEPSSTAAAAADPSLPSEDSQG